MTPKAITSKTLYYGDNLPILREHLADKSVDLIYLDPPINSNRSYNVQLFRDEWPSTHGWARGRSAMGIFVTLDDPTSDMSTEAVTAGYYHSPGWNKNYPRIQILTVAELLSGAEVKMPPMQSTFKQAPKAVRPDGDAGQQELFSE